jgi:glutathione S-transferase
LIVKLYYSSGTCSLAPHIILRETQTSFELERVDLRTHQTEHGVDFYTINVKGSVPLLELDDGERLTEGTIIAQYIADKAQHRELMPAPGTMARYRVMEWQAYISSELHKFYWPLFNSAVDETCKTLYRTTLRKKYEWVNEKLTAVEYLTGNTFTAADAYLFTVTRWARGSNVDVNGLDNLKAFMDRVNLRPTVRAAITAESHKKA